MYRAVIYVLVNLWLLKYMGTFEVNLQHSKKIIFHQLLLYCPYNFHLFLQVHRHSKSFHIKKFTLCLWFKKHVMLKNDTLMYYTCHFLGNCMQRGSDMEVT